MAVIVCPHCGTTNRAGSNFCNGCGTDLRRAGRDPVPPDEPESQAPPTAPSAEQVERGDKPAPEDRPTPVDSDAARSEASSTQEPAAEEASFVDSIVPDQPWLRIEFDADNDLDSVDETASQDRLVTGLQGLLEPVRISSRRQPDQTGDARDPDTQRDEDTVSSPPSASQSLIRTLHNLTPERQRTLRRLMSEQPIVRNSDLHPIALTTARVTWIIVLLGLAIAIPAFMGIPYPESAPMQWSGVQEAYLAIESLPTEASVLVYWAYDPATAGELDLPSLAVTGHLLDRQASTMIVTPLPLGPPTVRRLRERARTQPGRSDNLRLIADLTWNPPIQFLPGGVAVLPLVGQSLEQILTTPIAPPSPDLRFVLNQPQAMNVVFAVHAEDVQDWLEQVQPFTGAPVVAVTSAGADPMLRPYLDSGQLLGLVSGFDGAIQYQALVDQDYRRNDSLDFQRHTILQSWGHMAILVIIVIGNIAGFILPRRS